MKVFQSLDCGAWGPKGKGETWHWEGAWGRWGVGIHLGSQQRAALSAYLDCGEQGGWAGSLLLPLTQSRDSMVEETEVD